MAIVIDTYSRVNIQLGDYGNTRKAEKRNPMMVFLYTYYYKWRGVHLVKDDEENIGHMDEQYVELALLPGFVRGRSGWLLPSERDWVNSGICEKGAARTSGGGA